MSEKRYTLEEAQLELERRKCVIFGHDWDEIRADEDALPVGFFCSRCGQRLAVQAR